MESINTNNSPAAGEAKKSFVQLIKFAIVGASNTLVDMIVNIGLTKILELFASGGWITYAAKTVGYACGVLNSYILNSRWTFKEERKQDAREIFSFIGVNIAVLLISLGLIYAFTNWLHLDSWWMNLGLPEWLTKIIGGRLFCSLVATVICIFVNFILNKLFVFTGKKEPEQETEA
ncbi:MAG: GtrA family protein [Clostridia bacterium]|nr:GtrA family protein [Clostridia bacterium]MBQ5488985.1 GtrA family protein [Clostridia bacterium]